MNVTAANCKGLQWLHSKDQMWHNCSIWGH